MPSAPSPIVARLAKAMQLTMAVMFVYGIAKIIVLTTSISIPVLNSTSDPVFAVLLIALGGLWTWSSILYIRASKRSKASSELYSKAFDHPDDAFEKGKQTSQHHARRGKLLAVMGALVIILGATSLGVILFA